MYYHILLYQIKGWSYLHFIGNLLSSRQYFSQRHCPQHIPQGGGGQQPGGPAVVVHVGHGVDGVLHLVVHDGVDEHRHRVLGQDLNILLIEKVEREEEGRNLPPTTHPPITNHNNFLRPISQDWGGQSRKFKWDGLSSYFLSLILICVVIIILISCSKLGILHIKSNVSV